MNDILSMEDISRMKAIAAENGIKSGTFLLSREAYVDLRMVHDPYGIYRQRKMMLKVLPKTMVYRGNEWWHG